ncbi:MAG: hypothetical protein ABEJ79_00920 [Halolamina sp.]
MFPPGAPSRFDAVLAVLGVSVVVAAAAVASGVPITVVGAATSVVGGAALFEGLVRNPPTG